MKVLAVSSSPRLHGNSDLLCDQFLKGATEAGHSVKKIRLAEKSISPCAACDGCQSDAVCVKRDDMADILEDVISADVIILATPVYFYSMSAQMKIFIDRCFARFREIKGKDFYLIVTSAAPQHEAAEETIAGLRGFLRCLPEAREKEIIYGSGAWDRGDILRHPAYEKAFELGKNLSE